MVYSCCGLFCSAPLSALPWHEAASTAGATHTPAPPPTCPADCYRAERLDPGYARLYHRRADVYWALGCWDSAAQVGAGSEALAKGGALRKGQRARRRAGAAPCARWPPSIQTSHCCLLSPLSQDLARLVELGAGQDAAARLAEAQRRAASGEPANHYAVLGVKPSAVPGEMRAAYKQLALAHHPDRAARAGAGRLTHEAAHTIFKLLAHSWSVLGDAEARRHHDIAALRHKYRRYAF